MGDINIDEFYQMFNPIYNLLNQSNNENSIAKRMNNNSNNSNVQQNSSLTGLDRPEPNSNPQPLRPNNNDAISSGSAQNVASITTNNNKRFKIAHPVLNNIENSTTRENTIKKKRGRIKKGSTLTGIHTGTFPGNILRKNGTSFMKSIHSSLNKRCKKYKIKLKRIHFAQQFGYNEDNKKFIKQRLYQILRYENKHNQKIIEMMTNIYKDKIFMFLINCTFEYLYYNYIKEKNTIYFDEKDIQYKCFETLSEIALRKEESGEFKKDWSKEKFVETSKQFLKEVYGNGKLKYRRRRIPNKFSCEYEVVEKIENFFESQKLYIN